MSYTASGVRAQALCGAVGTGKTERLLGRVAELVENGVEPEQILLLSASQAAARELEERVRGALGGARVRVATPLGVALGLLDCDEAYALTGRRAHVLADFELDFFFEDMRVTGMDRRRLHGMLDFFFRGWSEMSDDDPAWLINEAEVNTQAFARRRLAMVESYHPCEVSAAAVRLLLADEARLEAHRVDYVLADDYRAMSRASQRLCRLLARYGLLVCWDSVATLVGEERYGYAGGLDELMAEAEVERVELKEFRRGTAAYTALGNLFEQKVLSGCVLPAPPCAQDRDIEVRMAPMLDDEAACVAGAVRDALGEGLASRDVFVCVPNDGWGRRVFSALEDAGVPASAVGERQVLHGDVRELDQCEAAVVYNALRLVADPGNALAWRCWCGFGDYLAHSMGFSALCDQMAATGQTLPQALESLARDAGVAGVPAMGPEKAHLAQGYLAGLRMVEAAAKKRGMELLELVCRMSCGAERVPAEVLALVGGVAGDEDAPTLAARACDALYRRTFAEQAVRVGSPDLLLGLSPKVLVFCGLVNGLYPPRRYFDLSEATIDEQAKMHARLVAQLAQVCGRAGERLVLWGFERAGIVESERLKLASLHVRLRGGKRVCDFAPSVVIDYVTGKKTCYER